MRSMLRDSKNQANPGLSAAGLSGALVALLVLTASGAAAADVPRAAVFDFELLDTSLEGELQGVRADQQQRLLMISELLREKLTESGRFEVVDTAPAAEEIAAAGYLYGCNGCEGKIAQGLGADLAFRGLVQKVSNLILNINLYIVDADSGQQLRGYSVDIRGNTDESWAHGISYILRNRLLKE